MSEQIKKLAEFMGWDETNSIMTDSNIIGDFELEAKFILCLGDTERSWRISKYDHSGGREFNPFTDANDTLLVEARLREKDLWGDYVEKLATIMVCQYRYDTQERKLYYPHSLAKLAEATLEQRMTAALQVIQESSDE